MKLSERNICQAIEIKKGIYLHMIIKDSRVAHLIIPKMYSRLKVI